VIAIELRSAVPIGLISQKGGVGKSTLSRALAREAASNGLKVKLADLDTQQGTCNSRCRAAPGRQPGFQRGKLTRFALDILRQTGEPLPVLVVAVRALARKGSRCPIRRSMRRTRHRLRRCSPRCRSAA
jgi:Mrp family chromosome partitioning ATPase